MSKEKEFVKNTIILLIGKFCTQFMSLLLIPLYTHFLSTDDYGSVDLIQTYITLFVPILTLKLDSAAFRFLIDVRNNENGKKTIISNIIIVMLCSLSIFSIAYFIINIFWNIPYTILTYINIFILMISNLYLQFLRGTGKNQSYTIVSIITAIITVIVNCVCILILKFNAGSILIASTVANIVAIIYISISIKITKYFSIKSFEKSKLKELLKYSIPMIPNELSWWIVNVSDRSIITYFLGAAFNGIYTISCKFSNIINAIFGIFNMSWQETTSLHIKDENREEFFSSMINKIFTMFSSLSLLLLVVLPFVYNIIIGENYSDSYKYIPIILLGNIFHILISLIGGIYVALKKVKQIANTTIISALINIILNLLFVKKLGLYAAALSTLIAYLILAIYRMIDVQKFVKINFKIKNIIIIIFLFLVVSLSYYLDNILINVAMLFIVSIYALIYNIELIKDGVMLLKKYIKKFA